MQTEQELREQVMSLDVLLLAKAGAIGAADERLRAIVDEALTPINGKRGELVAERSLLAAERDLLRDEGVELQRRRDAAELAVAKCRLDVREAEYQRCKAAATSARLELSAAADGERVFGNTADARRRAGASVNDLMQENANLAANVARLKVLSEGALRDQQRAILQRDRARGEHDETRRRLGLAP
jgi:hypothetical protein